MKKILFLSLVTLFFTCINFAQISVSSEKYNAIKEIIKVPEGMTFTEFLKIQREIDWKKIAVASFLPGYIHFYANKPELGWAIASTRIIGYGLIGYAMYDQYQLTNSVDYGIVANSTDEQNRTKKNAILFSSGLILNMIGFAFDWAHGDWVVEMERNEVYFKYGLNGKQRKTLGLSYNTEYKIPFVSINIQL
ncbi:MAG: hypothetical protein KKF62_14235 [Bacteroidetes bacterium]|nr:hypothetical protein [Bacteroidota bacterium]MBU1115363.1 hypothetical protein [Bacteroidota bacterium]MBU1797767.1 hypothetical protein [Bacteroidota bacterium]